MDSKGRHVKTLWVMLLMRLVLVAVTRTFMNTVVIVIILFSLLFLLVLLFRFVGEVVLDARKRLVLAITVPVIAIRSGQIAGNMRSSVTVV